MMVITDEGSSGGIEFKTGMEAAAGKTVVARCL